MKDITAKTSTVRLSQRTEVTDRIIYGPVKVLYTTGAYFFLYSANQDISNIAVTIYESDDGVTWNVPMSTEVMFRAAGNDGHSRVAGYIGSKNFIQVETAIEVDAYIVFDSFAYPVDVGMAQAIDVGDEVIPPASGSVSLSDSVTSSASNVAASSKAVKTAYDKGLEALAAANVAQNIANTALGNASTAQTAANEANSKIGEIRPVLESTSKTATDALNKANDNANVLTRISKDLNTLTEVDASVAREIAAIQEVADDAKEQADAAYAQTENLHIAVQNAIDGAATALSAAEGAAEKADEAKSQAETANATATEAANQATAALGAANSLEVSVNQALNAANSAEATANGLNESIQTAVANTQSAIEKADAVSGKITDIEGKMSLYGAADKIPVGGENGKLDASWLPTNYNPGDGSGGGFGISDAIDSEASDVAASSKAVKTAYDKAVEIGENIQTDINTAVDTANAAKDTAESANSAVSSFEQDILQVRIDLDAKAEKIHLDALADKVQTLPTFDNLDTIDNLVQANSATINTMQPVVEDSANRIIALDAKVSATAGANKIPMAGADGKLDADWLPEGYGNGSGNGGGNEGGGGTVTPSIEISDAIDSTSSETAASSLAVKTAYDKGLEGVEAASAINGKITTLSGAGLTPKAHENGKLDGSWLPDSFLADSNDDSIQVSNLGVDFAELVQFAYTINGTGLNMYYSTPTFEVGNKCVLIWGGYTMGQPKVGIFANSVGASSPNPNPPNGLCLLNQVTHFSGNGLLSFFLAYVEYDFLIFDFYMIAPFQNSSQTYLNSYVIQIPLENLDTFERIQELAAKFTIDISLPEADGLPTLDESYNYYVIDNKGADACFCYGWVPTGGLEAVLYESDDLQTFTAITEENYSIVEKSSGYQQIFKFSYNSSKRYCILALTNKINLLYTLKRKKGMKIIPLSDSTGLEASDIAASSKAVKTLNDVTTAAYNKAVEAGQPKEIDFENYTDLAIQSVTVPNYENRGCFEVDMPEDGIPILTVQQAASSSTDYMDWMNIYINGAIFQTFHTIKNTYTYCPLPWMKQGTHIRAICRQPTAAMKAFYKKYKGTTETTPDENDDSTSN